MARRPRLRHLPLSVQDSLDFCQRNQYVRLIEARRQYDDAVARDDARGIRQALAAERHARKWLRYSGISLREARVTTRRPVTLVGALEACYYGPEGVVMGTETHSTSCWDCGKLVRIEDTFSPKAKLDSPFEQRPAYCEPCFRKEELAGRARLVETPQGG